VGEEVECVEAGCALSAPGEGVASKLARRKKRIRQKQMRAPSLCECEGGSSVLFFFFFISASSI